MYKEIQRKLTSLTLMSIMFAGGMTFAVPGMMPAAYADGELYVSAEEIGNFAGIQVIEIVVNDPDRSETDETEGRPNVELNGKDVYMSQGDDGAWYAYVANQVAIDGSPDAATIYNATIIDSSFSGSQSQKTYVNATKFLEGVRDINTDGTGANEVHGNYTQGTNNSADALNSWPFIQTYSISDDSNVTIRYGTGSTAETVTLKYGYDDTKDISLDRTHYPGGSNVFVTLDDSLLNLSPTNEEMWIFTNEDQYAVYYYYNDGNGLGDSQVEILDWKGLGFEEGPFDWNTDGGLSTEDTNMHPIIQEDESDAVIFRTSDTDQNVFINWNRVDVSNLIAFLSLDEPNTISYKDSHSVIVDTFDATIKMDVPTDEWLSGIELDIEVTDEDKNLSALKEEKILPIDGHAPYIMIGNPQTLVSEVLSSSDHSEDPQGSMSLETDFTRADGVGAFSMHPSANHINFTYNVPSGYYAAIDTYQVTPILTVDFSKFGNTGTGTYWLNPQQFADVSLASSGSYLDSNGQVRVSLDTTLQQWNVHVILGDISSTIFGYAILDVNYYGYKGDLASGGVLNENIDRVNDAVYRFELEEIGANTGVFGGSIEYVMTNQLTIDDPTSVENSVDPLDKSVKLIVTDDMDGSDGLTISYVDIDSTTSEEIISVKEDANTHSGTISLDKESYFQGNTITATIHDADLNTDSDTIEIYTDMDDMDWIGNNQVYVVDVLINGQRYDDGGCTSQDIGIQNSGLTFTETSDDSGVFVGTMKLPAFYCEGITPVETNGKDIEFVYQDFLDASGKPNETSDTASIRSNTASISLDSTVYPVPIGTAQFETSSTNEHVSATPVSVTVSINDPDKNLAASGIDTIDLRKYVADNEYPLEITLNQKGEKYTFDIDQLLDNGVATETERDSGIFEISIDIAQTTYGANINEIQQGDILSVSYTDDADASGNLNTVSDSATFDLRNGVLQTDKSVYIIGSDAIVTLIDPDFNLDTDSEETLPLTLINWDSDAGEETLDDDIFNAEPAGLRETGDNTGIFQVVIEIPEYIDDSDDKLERGEQITLEYIDWGPAGAKFVGDDDEKIELDIFTSNFGATIELDQKVYTWTDKVYVTVVAPDHNFDSNKVDEIGNNNDHEIVVSTREAKIEQYKLVETGTDTGIFTGEVILTGDSSIDADGDGTPGDANGASVLSDTGSGPTDGMIPTGNEDGLTISFEYSDGDVAVGSALIRWNIGEVQWLEASYPATGTGVIRVIDPDMNLNPEAVDNFEINVWSDTSAGGISVGVTETNEATGIFEGSVFFTTTDRSSGSRLAVSEGDTVTAEYEDNTLPDPYSTADELDITATTLIGTIVPPLERAPAANLKTVDAFGNTLSSVSVDQQVQISVDITNGQDRNQDFAYLLQVSDSNGVTVSLSWITGSLSSGQSLSPATSWIPTEIGTYTATAFVWESVDNPTALSPPTSAEIEVNS